jgi:hypothetical protein
MDPFTINRLGHIRQQEILKSAAENRNLSSLRQIVWQLGVWLVAAGQKMITVANIEKGTVSSGMNMEQC